MANIAQIKLPDGTTYDIADKTSGYITGYTETDPIFSASAAAGITATDISNWDAKVSDDKTWKGVGLETSIANTDVINYVPAKDANTLTGNARWFKATPTPTAYAIAKYNKDSYLISTTPSANDNSTKVATTAYVDAAISGAGAGTITKVKTTAGAHTTINVSSGAAEFNVPTTAAHVGAVPTTRTVNGKALSSDITLSASDVSALPSSTVIPTITDTYSGTSSDGMSGKAVKSAIDALDGSVTGTGGAGKTLTALSQTNGIVTATFGNISITKSQISDFPTNVSTFTNDAGYVTTDEKLKTSALGVSTTTYYPVLTTDASAAETKKYSTLLQARYKDSNYDIFNLRVGNGVGVKGRLQLSNSGSSGDFTTLTPNATGDTAITLPSTSGTLALTSDIPTVPTISLNGSSTTSAAFYAPTSAGTNGYYLKSNGSGAPTWAAISAGTDEKLKTSVTTTTGTYYYPVLTGTSSSAETKKYAEGLNFVMDNNSNWLTIGTSSKGGKLSLLKTHEAIIVLNNSMTTNTTITLPATTGTLALTSEIPTVPINVSAFTNDAGYLTAHQTIPVTDVKMNGSSIVSGGIAAITNASGDVTFNGTVQGNLYYMNLSTSDPLYAALPTAWITDVIV